MKRYALFFLFVPIFLFPRPVSAASIRTPMDIRAVRIENQSSKRVQDRHARRTAFANRFSRLLRAVRDRAVQLRTRTQDTQILARLSSCEDYLSQAEKALKTFETSDKKQDLQEGMKLLKQAFEEIKEARRILYRM